MSTSTEPLNKFMPVKWLPWHLPLQGPGLRGRGAVILVACILFLLGPGLRESDIIVIILCSVLSVLILLCLTISGIGSIGLRRKPLLSFSAPHPDSFSTTSELLPSKTPLPFLVENAPIRIPPFFELSVSIHFAKDEAPVTQHYIPSSGKKPIRFTENKLFPHRGNWEVSHYEFRFGDQMGFTGFCWRQEPSPQQKYFMITPKQEAFATLPVISSAHRAGDDLLESRERTGESFDLKPYHPSDGIRKIVWKVYARTGELISRHPEPSVTPEGKSLIFALAGKYDDRTAARCLQYLEKLESLGIDILFSCEGHDGSPVSNTNNAERAIIESVWETENSSPETVAIDLQRLLPGMSNSGSEQSIDTVVIFASTDRISYANGSGLCLAAGEVLDALGIDPIFILQREEIQQTANQPNSHLESFLQSCSRRNWRVIY